MKNNALRKVKKILNAPLRKNLVNFARKMILMKSLSKLKRHF